MKIGIDLSPINKRKAGIGYFTKELTNALIKIDSVNSYVLYSNSEESFSEIKFKQSRLRLIESSEPNFGWIKKTSEFISKECDILISPSNFSFSFFYKNTFQVVHDIAPILFPEFFPRSASLKFRILLWFALRRSSKILVPLESIRQELIEQNLKYANKIEVIGEGLNKSIKVDIPNDRKELLKKKFGITSKFIFSSGTLEPRKNHLNMIRAFKHFSNLHSDYKFYIAGKKGWFYEDIFKLVDKLELNEKVVFTDYLTDEELSFFYQECSFFIFCSYYEGFGLPPLEASQFGKNIILSNIPSFREIFRDKALFCEPNDPIDIADKMISADKDSLFDYSEILEKFTWENSAKKVLNIVKSNSRN